MNPTPGTRRELYDLLGQLRDGQLDQSGLARLDALVSGDPAARRLYLDYVDLCASLHWAAVAKNEGSGARGQGSESGIRDSGFGIREPESPVPSPETPGPAPEPLIPPIIIDTSGSFDIPRLSLHSTLGGWLVSYAAATAIVGAAIVGAWLYKVSVGGGADIAANSREPTAPGDGLVTNSRRLTAAGEDAVQCVGRITGLADCRWAEPPAAAVRLGGKYALSSGLVEISYQSGAKVILEGPCAYEVDSPAGGFLALGKLTARVEELSAVSDQQSELPTPKSQISKFVVRTPTAVVTDLGTEFGVEVDASGVTRSHVFRGKVELRPANANEAAGRRFPVISLTENESASVRIGQDQAVMMSREPVAPGKFVRDIPRRVAIELFDTGVGLKEGDPDPHWQLVARSDDQHFQPQPAVVTAIAPNTHWLPNDCGPSQWISAANNVELPDRVTYTFRTTFELVGMVRGTAVLQGRFAVDNRVAAIRLNGTHVPVPDQGDTDPQDRYHEFVARNGFVEGVNSLELDVYNGDPADPSRSASPMGLRIERLEGWSVLSGREPPPTPREPRRKEGASMN